MQFDFTMSSDEVNSALESFVAAKVGDALKIHSITVKSGRKGNGPTAKVVVGTEAAPAPEAEPETETETATEGLEPAVGSPFDN